MCADCVFVRAATHSGRRNNHGKKDARLKCARDRMCVLSGLRLPHGTFTHDLLACLICRTQVCAETWPGLRGWPTNVFSLWLLVGPSFRHIGSMYAAGCCTQNPWHPLDL